MYGGYLLCPLYPLLACLHGGGEPQAGEVKKTPPLHAIFQPPSPGVHYLKIIEWSLCKPRKEEKCWQTTCFGD